MTTLIIAFALASASVNAAKFPLACTYVSKQPQAELESHLFCATRRDGRLYVSPLHLRSMQFSDHGLASLVIEGTWHYVNRSGELLPVLTYDNGPDSFQEGLVRSLVGGKVAFYDASFRQVVPPKYEWAWPFESGRALVCSGCSFGDPDADGHIAVLGGRWGYIDRSGKEIVPVTHTKEEAWRL